MRLVEISAAAMDTFNTLKFKDPERIPLGIGRQTAPNPYLQRGKDYSGHFKGNPDSFQFASNVQKINYENLKAILARYGLRFNYFAASTYAGQGSYWNRSGNPKLQSFVGTTDIENPKFVWWKYEGATAGGGRNWVYVGGKAMKLSDFLSMPPLKQDKLFAEAGIKPKKGANVAPVLKPKFKDKLYKIQVNAWGKNTGWRNFDVPVLIKATTAVSAEKKAIAWMKRNDPKVQELVKKGWAFSATARSSRPAK